MRRCSVDLDDIAVFAQQMLKAIWDLAVFAAAIKIIFYM